MSEYSWPSENGRFHEAGTAAEWLETVRSLPVGTPIAGEVTGRQPFGAFLSLDGHPEAVGLARVDRMPRCMELPTVGQVVTGEVVWHAEHNHQVGVALREWAEHEDLLPQFVERVGQVVTGRVTKIAPIGFFVRIADCVEGLVPLAEPAADMAMSVREGQDVSVRIVAVDLDRTRVVLAAEGVA
ncbi:S1 RNA-binding domain-containing protein [Streptomyces sp. NBC_01808]|uniref:S1 RNA-binding domain-containing protein n=1 Tax=Streptomyces sp. NBC_01808 TaxID=2975947 RepID=UPI002DDBB34F|nr:S1 RNA-binding domain-containing protein [Streptomyces sp. NBC_01808]WSA37094.1 S1 RNA-binding domain-containing protein [Streptomyces sp. NBC_01808]